MFSLADSNFDYLSFFMNTGPGVFIRRNRVNCVHTENSNFGWSGISLIIGTTNSKHSGELLLLLSFYGVNYDCHHFVKHFPSGVCVCQF